MQNAHTKSGGTITHPPCMTVKMAATLIHSGQKETWFSLLYFLVVTLPDLQVNSERDVSLLINGG